MLSPASFPLQMGTSQSLRAFPFLTLLPAGDVGACLPSLVRSGTDRTEDAQAINPSRFKDPALFNYQATTKEQLLKSSNWRERARATRTGDTWTGDTTVQHSESQKQPAGIVLSTFPYIIMFFKIASPSTMSWQWKRKEYGKWPPDAPNVTPALTPASHTLPHRAYETRTPRMKSHNY